MARYTKFDIKFFKENIYHFILCGIGFFMPLDKGFSNVLVIFLVVLAVLPKKNGNKRKAKHITLYRIIITVYFLSLSISLIYSEDIVNGGKILFRKLPLILIPICLYFYPSIKKNQVRNILYAFSLTVTILSVYCFLYAYYNYITGIDLNIFKVGGIYYTKPINLHPRYFSMFIVLSIAFFLNEINSNSLIKPFFLVLGIIFLSLSIVFMSSRTSFITLILIIAIFLYENYGKYKLPIKSLFVISTIILISLFIAFKSKFSERFVDERAFGLKGEQIHASLLVFKDAPLLGHGLGDSKQKLLEKYSDLKYEYSLEKEYNSHNQYLEELTSIGIIGFVIFVLCIIYPILLHITGHKKISKIHLYFLVIFYFACTSESILLRQKGIIFYSFFNTLLFNVNYNKE